MVVTDAVLETLTLCSRPTCNEPVLRRGVCLTHYRKIRAAGLVNNHVDMTPVVERIANLRANRWTFARIGRVAGINPTIPSDIYGRRQKRCSRKTFNAIMAIPPYPSVAVTPIGFKRRVQALAWMGHSQKTVAAAVGSTDASLRASVYTGKFSFEYGQKLADVYDKLSLIEGNDRLAQSRARGILGYAPPAAWDDDTIDTAPDLPRGIVAGRTNKKVKTHCRHGHRMTGENVFVRGDGRVTCRQCHIEGCRSYRARRAA